MWERVSEMREQVHRDGVRKGLEDIADPERFAEIAEAILDCHSDAELRARMGM